MAYFVNPVRIRGSGVATPDNDYICLRRQFWCGLEVSERRLGGLDPIRFGWVVDRQNHLVGCSLYILPSIETILVGLYV